MRRLLSDATPAPTHALAEHEGTVRQLCDTGSARTQRVESGTPQMTRIAVMTSLVVLLIAWVRLSSGLLP